MNELTTTNHGPLAKLLDNPDKLAEFPVEHMERLLAMQERWQAEQARMAFADAFHRVQSQLTPVVKRGENKQTTSFYALAEDVYAMACPILSKEGFSHSFSQGECDAPDMFRFTMTLRHVGGHVETHFLDAPIDNIGPRGTPNKSKMHGLFSSNTSCNRVLMVNVLGIQLTDDRDGNKIVDDGPISDETVKLMSEKIYEADADGAKFCKFFGVVRIEDIPKSRMKEAFNLLERKRQETKKKATAE